jgi:hypothetical protein
MPVSQSDGLFGSVATFDINGQGVVALSPGTKKLFVHIVSFPLSFRQGNATPTNYYDVGLLRFSFQGAVYPTVPIDARDQLVLVPQDADALGFSVFGSALVRVTEA